MRAQLVALVFTIVAGLVLIPRFQMSGAATATLLAYSAFTVYLFVRRSKKTVDVAAPTEGVG